MQTMTTVKRDCELGSVTRFVARPATTSWLRVAAAYVKLSTYVIPSHPAAGTGDPDRSS